MTSPINERLKARSDGTDLARRHGLKIVPLSAHEDSLASLLNLRKWTDQDQCPLDNVYRYVDGLHCDDEFDAVRLGRDIWRMMFEETVEEYSAIDAVFSGIAALAYRAACSNMANLLGINERDLEDLLRECAECGPRSISHVEFLECIKAKADERMQRDIAQARLRESRRGA